MSLPLSVCVSARFQAPSQKECSRCLVVVTVGKGGVFFMGQ